MANTLRPIAEDLEIMGQEVLADLKASLVFVPNVKQHYTSEFKEGGDTIKLPYTFISGEAQKRTTGGAVTAESYGADTTSVTVEQYVYAVSIDNLQKTLSSVSLMEDAAKKLARGIAVKADRVVAGLWNQIPHEVGKVDGTGAFNSTDKFKVLNDARKRLTKNKAPLNDLRCIFGSEEMFNLRSIDDYMKVDASGTKDRQTGEVSPILGFRLFESLYVENATLSTTANWGTPLVDNAGGYAIGASTIHVDGVASGATIKKGSTFSLGGNSYVVTEDATATVSDIDLKIYPKLRTAVADNDAITPVAHSAEGSQNFAFDPGAFAFASAPLAPWHPQSGITSVLVGDPETGLTVRLSYQGRLLGGAGEAMTESIVADALFGAAVIRPDLAVRVTGKAE